jgi:cell division septation protein DedD
LAKNEEGEFELILGNRQLISVFLIVVILLGVFFSMGYIVGRNSAPVVAAENARSSKASTEATAEPAQASPPSQPASSAPAPKAPEETKASPLASTHPEQPAPSATPAAAPPAEPPKLKPAPVVARPSVPTDPAPGDYWQVVATARPDAEIISEALVKKGFHAVVAPAPKDGVFRVLVGPLRDAATQAQTRTQLEAAGFKNPLIRKY